MRKVLNKRFFERSAIVVAKELLGKFLVRRSNGKDMAYIIAETEAYDGSNDKASHASRGETERNKVMFGEAGRFYVYFTYGMHWMLNVTTGKVDYPAAVLIRGVEEMSGPGRLTKMLKITKTFNGKKALPEKGLWFEDRGIRISKKSIRRTPRIGINYAGPVWTKKLYRFLFTDV